jgi:hypothetical protein
MKSIFSVAARGEVLRVTASEGTELVLVDAV